MPRDRVGGPLPRTFEAELARALAPMRKQILAAAKNVRTPADVRRLGAALRKRWPDQRIRAIVEAVGRKAEARSARPFERLAKAAEGTSKRGDNIVRMDAPEYDGAALVATWARKAAKLITAVRGDVAKAMAADVAAALERGDDPAKLAAVWRKRGLPLTFGTLEGRTKVIAQHQLGMLHAQVQRTRARSLGITDFVWRTQGDGDVRDEHQALADTRHAYAEPPSEGLPGEPVNCRCWAESVIPDALLGGFGVGAAIE